MSDPIYIVTGFVRCGTSLVMQMLHAAGMPTFPREGPAFEHPASQQLADRPILLSELPGNALKIIDPQRCLPPKGPDYRFIWVRRNYLEQAKSTAKLLRITERVELDADDIKALRKSFYQEEPRAQALVRSVSQQDILVVQFEDLINAPTITALVIAGYCGLPAGSADRMAAVVKPRTPNCLEGMLEFELLEETKKAA